MSLILIVLIHLLAQESEEVNQFDYSTYNLLSHNSAAFYLYHSDNIYKGTEIISNDLDSLQKSKFDERKPTKFIIHGWTDDKDAGWLQEMREVMAITDLWNVIIINWAPLSQTTFQDAFDHSLVVGEELADFTKFLISSTKTTHRSIHFIGHGLGALVANYASKTIETDTCKLIQRITALDPTLTIRIRSKNASNVIVVKMEAKFVDVIHTNGGEYGTFEALGDVDYYPNGGKHQPGCGSPICSHTRACEYFIASIFNPRVFKAYNYKYWHLVLKFGQRFPSFPMGIAAGATIPKGSYFVETTDDYPYVYSKHVFI